MSADGSVTLAWADGEKRFRLPIAQLYELQDACGAGPVEIFDRLQDRRWRVQDVRETIRLGLIGGGMDPARALAFTQRYVDTRPLLENVGVAVGVIAAALVGVPGDEAGKASAEGAASEATDASSSPRSSEPAP